MRSILSLKHPFFAPAWRRVAIVVALLLAGLVIFLLGASLLGTVICAAAFWLGYELLVTFDPNDG
jgi:hypothetical protein